MKRNISLYIFMIISALLCASCVNDNSSGDCSTYIDSNKVQVKFTIAMESPTNGTRAGTWGDDYDKETADYWENTIEPGKIQVLVFDKNYNYMGEVENFSTIRRDTPEDNIYDIVGDLTDETLGNSTTFDGKFVVFANYDKKVTLTKGEKLSDIEIADLAYAYSKDEIAQRTKYIPMWGIQSYNGAGANSYAPLNFVKGKREDAKEIFMLRAMAKIQVRLSDEVAKEYKLAKVSLSKYNTNGYIVPNDFATTKNTKDVSYGSNALNPNTEAQQANLDFQTLEENKSYIIYVPEYKNNTTAEDPIINITLTSEDGTQSQDYDLYFKDYKEGKPTGDNYDIVRNTIYDYEITGVGKLQVDFQVLPWNLVTSEIGWNVTAEMYAWRSKSGEIQDPNPNDATVGDNEGRWCLVNYPGYDDDDPNHNTLKWSNGKSGTSGAAYYFKLSAPAGAVWTAHLSNTDDFKFSYSGYDINGDKKNDRYCASTGIAREEPYQIKVEAKNPWFLPISNVDFTAEETEWGKKWTEKWKGESGPSTELYITVSLDGNPNHSYSIPINKSDKNVKKTYYKDNRRFAGGDEYIKIWQLKATKGTSYDDMQKANAEIKKYLK